MLHGADPETPACLGARVSVMPRSIRRSTRRAPHREHEPHACAARSAHPELTHAYDKAAHARTNADAGAAHAELVRTEGRAVHHRRRRGAPRSLRDDRLLLRAATHVIGARASGLLTQARTQRTPRGPATMPDPRDARGATSRGAARREGRHGGTAAPAGLASRDARARRTRPGARRSPSGSRPATERAGRQWCGTIPRARRATRGRASAFPATAAAGVPTSLWSRA